MIWSRNKDGEDMEIKVTEKNNKGEETADHV